MQIWPILVAYKTPLFVSVGIVVALALLTKTPPGRRCQERVLTWFAVRLRFRWWALRRYRNGVLKADAEVPLPFASPGSQSVRLADIYIGRSVVDDTAAESPRSRHGRRPKSMEWRLGGRLDASDTSLDGTEAAACTVVVAEPGSGKSLLLQELLHGWAASDGDGLIPVRIELSDLVPGLKPDKPHPLDPAGELHPLRHLLVRSLELRGVPHPQRFVFDGLGRGRLWLLCDGLDEVAKANEDAVRRLLAAAREYYPGCRITVTCRTAVYRERLRGFETLRLGGFSEADIDEFLNRWASRPDSSPQRIRRLSGELYRDRVRLRPLAASPLLLTFMASVYGRSSDNRSMPHTRTGFYREVVEFLLTHKTGQEHSSETVHVALQHVALAAMAAERQVLGHAQVVAALVGALSTVGLPAEAAPELLDGIVKRTGLIRKLHARNEYQFAHLNLQEYFAATTFGEDAPDLLATYRRDRDNWREVVRLWCGHSASPAVVIDAVEPEDLALAIACLAETDGEHVPEWLDGRIVGAFVASEFEDGVASDEAMGNAIAYLAADSRPLGNRLRRLIMDLAEHDEADRFEVYWALGLSGHPEATDFVMRRAKRNRDAKSALDTMADIAVDTLWRLLSGSDPENGGDSAAVIEYGYEPVGFERELVADIAGMRLPSAWRRLTEALCDSRREVQVVAARILAEGVREPDVEAVLRKVDFTREPASYLAWRPFAAGCTPDFVRLMNTVAEILVDPAPKSLDAEIGDLNSVRIDERLAMFLLTELATRWEWGIGEGLRTDELRRRNPTLANTVLLPTPKSETAFTNTPLAVLDRGEREAVLSELITEAHLSWDHSGDSQSHSSTWHRAALRTVPDAVQLAVLATVLSPDHDDIETAWDSVPDSSSEPSRAVPVWIRHLPWVTVAAMLVGFTLAPLTLAGPGPAFPSWFTVVAYGAATVGLLSLLFQRDTIASAIGRIVVIAALLPIIVVAWSQIAVWLGWPLAVIATVAAATAVGAVAKRIVERDTVSDVLDRKGGVHFLSLYLLAPTAPLALLCLYRLLVHPWGPMWLQWFAGIGAVVSLLCLLHVVTAILLHHRYNVTAFLPIAVSTGFGLSDRFGPVAATAIAAAGFLATAIVIITSDRQQLKLENPLRDVLVDLAAMQAAKSAITRSLRNETP